jgi:hypothetical protein
MDLFLKKIWILRKNVALIDNSHQKYILHWKLYILFLAFIYRKEKLLCHYYQQNRISNLNIPSMMS